MFSILELLGATTSGYPEKFGIKGHLDNIFYMHVISFISLIHNVISNHQDPIIYGLCSLFSHEVKKKFYKKVVSNLSFIDSCQKIK